jgi:hypothetical protein
MARGPREDKWASGGGRPVEYIGGTAAPRTLIWPELWHACGHWANPQPRCTLKLTTMRRDQRPRRRHVQLDPCRSLHRAPAPRPASSNRRRDLRRAHMPQSEPSVKSTLPYPKSHRKNEGSLGVDSLTKGAAGTWLESTVNLGQPGLTEVNPRLDRG